MTCLLRCSIFVLIHWTIPHYATSAEWFFCNVTSFVSLFRDTFQAFLPSFCAAVCHCCEGLVCTLYTGGLCAFPCLSPCSRSNLLPGSLPLPLPFSAWPVVAMPPHHTVIVWSLMATMIRLCRLRGDGLFAGCKLLLPSHSWKWLLTLNERKSDAERRWGKLKAFLQIYNADPKLRRSVHCLFTTAAAITRPWFETSLY